MQNNRKDEDMKEKRYYQKMTGKKNISKYNFLLGIFYNGEYLCIHKHMYIHVYIYTLAFRIYACIYLRIYSYTRTHNIYTHIYACVHTFT